MDKIKERFAEFSRPGYYSRVDSKHILDLYIGLDDYGRRSIKLRAKFKPNVVRGTNSIEINQFKNEDYNTIVFSLLDEDVGVLFYNFCYDLIESSRSLSDKSFGYITITNRFTQWKRLFLKAKCEFLTEPEIMGLIGEVLFLKSHLFKIYGIHDAINGWSGQELTHKDFSYSDIWYEVKTINRGNQAVRISSIEQLDSDIVGELVVYILEKMSPAFNGINLNKLVFDVYNSIDSELDKEAFFTKVTMQGFIYNEYYDNFVYEINDIIRFQIDEYFPKLDRRNIPYAITKAQYDLLLNEIKEFQIK